MNPLLVYLLTVRAAWAFIEVLESIASEREKGLGCMHGYR
jgi:hypothetical protein